MQKIVAFSMVFFLGSTLYGNPSGSSDKVKLEIDVKHYFDLIMANEPLFYKALLELSRG